MAPRDLAAAASPREAFPPDGDPVDPGVAGDRGEGLGELGDEGDDDADADADADPAVPAGAPAPDPAPRGDGAGAVDPPAGHDRVTAGPLPAGDRPPPPPPPPEIPRARGKAGAGRARGAAAGGGVADGPRWQAKYEAKLRFGLDGREAICVALGGAWAKLYQQGCEDLALVGKAPAASLEDIAPALVIALDRRLPPDLELTPEGLAIAATADLAVRHILNRRAIREARAEGELRRKVAASRLASEADAIERAKREAERIERIELELERAREAARAVKVDAPANGSPTPAPPPYVPPASVDPDHVFDADDVL